MQSDCIFSPPLFILLLDQEHDKFVCHQLTGPISFSVFSSFRCSHGNCLYSYDFHLLQLVCPSRNFCSF